MVFKGIDNQYVALSIKGYQETNPINCKFQDNWLKILFDINSNLGKLEFLDSYLLTFEVQKLIDWFKALSGNEKPLTTLCEFLEPNLKIELRNNWEEDVKEFRINLSKNDKVSTTYVDFRANNTELFYLANELRLELNLYPTRYN